MADLSAIERTVAEIIAPIVAEGRSRDPELWGPPIVGPFPADVENCTNDVRKFVLARIRPADLSEGLTGNVSYAARVKSVLEEFLRYNEKHYMVEWTPGLVADVLPSAIATILAE